MANIWDLQKGIEMECKWLVERDVFPENEIKLTVALKTLGIQVKTTALSEIEEVGYSKAEYLPYPADKEECVVFYGSLNMMRALMRKQSGILVDGVIWIICNAQNTILITANTFLIQTIQ